MLLIITMAAFIISCKHSKKTTGETKSAPKAIVKNSDQKSQAARELAKAGINVRDLQNHRLSDFIQDWYGVPYRYGGCQKAGVDCSCFANLLYEEVYGKKLSRSSLDIFKLCDKISLENAKEGDLLFFKIGGSAISHVGVFLQSNIFIHSSTSRGVIVNSVDEAYYKKYFFCAGKMKDI